MHAQVCYPRKRTVFTSSAATPSATGTSTSSISSNSFTSTPPYTDTAASAAPGTQPDASWFCAPSPPPGVLISRSYPTPWPTPAAYYPLTQVCLRCCGVDGVLVCYGCARILRRPIDTTHTNICCGLKHHSRLCHNPLLLQLYVQDLDSFPASQLSGTSHRTTFDPTDRCWGGALTCNAATASFAALQPPAGFGQRGGLAVSVWVKLPQVAAASNTNIAAAASGNAASGFGGYEYVLSLTQAGSTGSSATNQVGRQCIGVVLLLLLHCRSRPAVGARQPRASLIVRCLPLLPLPHLHPLVLQIPLLLLLPPATTGLHPVASPRPPPLQHNSCGLAGWQRQQHS